MNSPMPATGGTYFRDPKTGVLTRAEDLPDTPPVEPPPPQPAEKAKP